MQDANALLAYKRQAPPPPRSPAHRLAPPRSPAHRHAPYPTAQQQQEQQQQQPFQQHFQQQHQPFQQQQQQPPFQAPPPPMGVYDVRWEAGALGLRFTPNEQDAPVVCQILPTASDAVTRSRVAVGDIVVAVQVHAIGAPMAPITSLQEMAQVFQHEELPITVRFRSRAQDAPQPMELVDIAHSYTYTWPPGHPLGVSLAMDPCSLHTIITSIDHERISADFLPLGPMPGDLLVSVRDAERKADLDALRFDQVVETLKSFPRPCKLTFARLHEEVASPTSGERRRTVSGQRNNSVHAADQIAPQSQQSPYSQQPAIPQAPFSAPPAAPARQPMRRPAPLMKRQSFAVGEMKKQQQEQQASEEEARKKAKRDARFFKIVYSGGSIGLVLKDAKLELKGKPKKNGYYAVVKSVPRNSPVEGMDQASEGDELIAIGMHDLQHMAFEDVQKELSSIRSPTPLVFQRKPQVNVSVGASLASGLVLFLM